MDDSSLLDMPSLQDKQSKKARKAHDFWSTPSRDAIEDEGEPEELFDDLAANVPLHTSIDKSAGHWWGPFRFDHVRRAITRGQNRGSIEMQWQVTCLYHHDKDDPEATKCRKTKGYEGQDQSRAVCRQLRQWCLDGRLCTSRKTKLDDYRPHLKEKLKKVDFIDDDVLDMELEEALADDGWLLEGKPRRRRGQAKGKAVPHQPLAAPASPRPSAASRCAISSSSSSSSSSGTSSTSS